MSTMDPTTYVAQQHEQQQQKLIILNDADNWNWNGEPTI